MATIEDHLQLQLQQAEAEAIDDANAAIIHDDQQPLTSSFGVGVGVGVGLGLGLGLGHGMATNSMSSFGVVEGPDR